MGRETYTFKLNEQKLSTTLADALQSELKDGLSFFEYVSKENDQLSKYRWMYINLQHPLSAGEIISTFRSSPEKVNALHLGVAANWLWQLHKIGDSASDDLASIFAHYGFEQIYEIGQRDQCWVYVNQLYTYAYMNDLEDNKDVYDGEYHLWGNAVYKEGLDYLLILLSKICLDKDYRFSDINRFGFGEEYLAFLNNHKKNLRLIEQAERALAEIRDENEEEELKEEADANYRRPITASHYFVAQMMFGQIKEVQESIKDCAGRILILDSQ